LVTGKFVLDSQLLIAAIVCTLDLCRSIPSGKLQMSFNLLCCTCRSTFIHHFCFPVHASCDALTCGWTCALDRSNREWFCFDRIAVNYDTCTGNVPERGRHLHPTCIGERGGGAFDVFPLLRAPGARFLMRTRLATWFPSQSSFSREPSFNFWPCRFTIASVSEHASQVDDFLPSTRLLLVRSIGVLWRADPVFRSLHCRR